MVRGGRGQSCGVPLQAAAGQARPSAGDTSSPATGVQGTGGWRYGGWVWQGGVGGLGDHHSVCSCCVVGVPVLLVDAGWGDVLV